jgi:hypothetical protein
MDVKMDEVFLHDGVYLKARGSLGKLFKDQEPLIAIARRLFLMKIPRHLGSPEAKKYEHSLRMWIRVPAAKSEKDL